MRLRELRIMNEMTQTDVGKAVGTSPQTILNWENGIHEPDIEHLIALADLFNVTIDYLVGRDFKSMNQSELISNAFRQIDPDAFAEFVKREIEKSMKKIK
ncbi:MAG: helix-turn-helix transcriptional regulator [Bacilli bacterium]|nr:helix-turn-helix transcriptional regulator [Bacilli bacterium]